MNATTISVNNHPGRAALIAHVRNYATAHYERGGWDTIVECWDDEQIAEQIGNARTFAGAIEKMRPVVAMYREKNEEAQAYREDYIAKRDAVRRAAVDGASYRDLEDDFLEAEAAAAAKEAADLEAARAAAYPDPQDDGPRGPGDHDALPEEDDAGSLDVTDEVTFYLGQIQKAIDRNQEKARNVAENLVNNPLSALSWSGDFAIEACIAVEYQKFLSAVDMVGLRSLKETGRGITDDGIKHLAREFLEDWTQQLVRNHHRSTSTCPFHNAVAEATREGLSRLVSDFSGSYVRVLARL